MSGLALLPFLPACVDEPAEHVIHDLFQKYWPEKVYSGFPDDFFPFVEKGYGRMSGSIAELYCSREVCQRLTFSLSFAYPT